MHTSIEHSRDWCRSLLILNCQELAAQQPLRPINWCSRLLKMTGLLSNPIPSRRLVHTTTEQVVSAVLCTRYGQPNEPVQSPSENDIILAGSLLAGLNGRSVDLIARNGDARSRAGRPPSSDLAMVDAGAHRRMRRCQLEVGGHRRRPGAIVGNGDAAARRARPGRLGIVGCGDARARRKKTASGCPRRQVCMRFREEETAPAIREENRAA